MRAPKGSILLVVPPFQSITRPALGVSQLKAILDKKGFSTEIFYLNLRFAEHIGPNIYEWISNNTTTVLLGEFIFSHFLFECKESDIEKYLEEVLSESEIGHQFPRFSEGKSKLETLRHLIYKTSDFILNDAIEEIIAKDPWMVGLTSTFQQNCVSVLLIRLIKQRQHEIITVMGGANCQSVMGEELFARFPEIDYIGQGECDHSFVKLIWSLLSGESKHHIKGFLSRDNNQSLTSSEPLKSEDLDRLPYPAFSDYFAQLSKVNFKDCIIPGLVMETSRGCWWGAMHKCTFCGLNGEDVGFRSKSASRVLEEMADLVKKYAVPRIELTDNILDMKYFKTLLPQLATNQIADFFYETRPTLSKEQVQMLSRSNIKFIQPGIESFSNRSLQLMHKGTTVLQNIQLLKWCTEVGIIVAWNYLFGFPGENEEEISEIALIVKAVHHLQPPGRAQLIHLDRFSPYFMAPEQYGLEPIYPAKPYRYVYPFPDKSLTRIAYFYQSDPLVKKSGSYAFKALRKIVSAWGKAYYRSHLLAIPRKNSLVIIDTRICRQRFLHILTNVRRRVYEYCDKARSLSEILETLRPEVNHSESHSVLQSLVRARLMLEVNGRYLSLATDWRNGYKKFTNIFPGGMVMESKQSKELKRYLLDTMKKFWWYLHDTIRLKIRLWSIFTAVLRKTFEALKKAFAKLVLKTIFFFAKLLCEERRGNAR